MIVRFSPTDPWPEAPQGLKFFETKFDTYVPGEHPERRLKTRLSG